MDFEGTLDWVLTDVSFGVTVFGEAIRFIHSSYFPLSCLFDCT
jgi:hypothetical protein